MAAVPRRILCCCCGGGGARDRTPSPRTTYAKGIKRMMHTVEGIARDIQLEIDEYRRQRSLIMSAELDIYRNKKEKEAKMMIEREHMIAEGLITSGDTLTILFTKNMEILNHSTTSSINHLLTVDVPSVAARTIQEDNSNETTTTICIDHSRIQSFKDSINDITAHIRSNINREDLAYERVKGHDTVSRRLLDEIVIQHHKICRESIVQSGRNVLRSIPVTFNTLWRDVIPSKVDSFTQRCCHDNFIKEVKEELDAWYVSQENEESNEADPKAIIEVMKDATCGVKHDNMRLRRELVKKAIKAVEKKEQQSNRNMSSIEYQQQASTEHGYRIVLTQQTLPIQTRVNRVHIEDLIKQRIERAICNVDGHRSIEIRRVLQEVRSHLVPHLIESLLYLREYLMNDGTTWNIPNAAKKKKSTIISTSECLCYYLAVLDISISWRVKLAMSILLEVISHGHAREKVVEEIQRIVIEEENRRNLHAALD